MSYLKKSCLLSIHYLNMINVDAANVNQPQSNASNEKEHRRDTDR